MTGKEARLLRRLTQKTKRGDIIWHPSNTQKCYKHSYENSYRGKSKYEPVSLEDKITSEEILTEESKNLCYDGFLEVKHDIGEGTYPEIHSIIYTKNKIKEKETVAVIITNEGWEKADELFWLGWTKNTWRWISSLGCGSLILSLPFWLCETAKELYKLLF